MASEQANGPDLREAAKGGIITQDQNDPDLADAMSEARREVAALQHKREENSHARAMAAIEQGRIGKALGGREEKSGNIAFIVILICFAIIVTAFFRMDLAKEFDAPCGSWTMLPSASPIASR